MNQPVAILGTGDSGSAMARRLLQTGFPVRVWNRTTSRARPLADDGALICATAAEAVRSTRVVVVTVFDTQAVLDVLRHIAPALEPDTVVVQSATVGGEITEVIETASRLDVPILDAPFLGNPGPAARGELTLMVAGTRPHKVAATPVLEALASHVVDVDDRPGGASLLKLVCNAWLFGMNAMAAQSAVLAEAFGLDPSLFIRAVTGTHADSAYLHYRSAQLTGRSEEALSPVRAAVKDLRHLRAASASAGVPDALLSTIQEIYDRAGAAGLGDRDLASIRDVLAPVGETRRVHVDHSPSGE
ncbi:NAD(P)-dependent oxidoreductase [Streptomyces sp. AA1529]|uniref:NAD(P)-dependent oxidoreductase n=1 Tax=Streptomyces sp. AA1529 TaxID=1203257 RepID=UPI003D765336